MDRTLLLVRHGDVGQDAIDRRDADPHISAEGRRNATRLAETLYRSGVTEVLTSPLRRALATAHAIAVRTGTHAWVWQDLVESNGWGTFRTAPPAEMLQLCPAARFDGPVPDGGWLITDEAVSEARSRAAGVAAKLVSRTATCTAVVSHATFMTFLLRIFLRAGDDVWFDQQHCCLNRLVLVDGGVRVATLNDTCHLSRDGCSRLT